MSPCEREVLICSLFAGGGKNKPTNQQSNTYNFLERIVRHTVQQHRQCQYKLLVWIFASVELMCIHVSWYSNILAQSSYTGICCNINIKHLIGVSTPTQNFMACYTSSVKQLSNIICVAKLALVVFKIQTELQLEPNPILLVTRVILPED